MAALRNSFALLRFRAGNRGSPCDLARLIGPSICNGFASASRPWLFRRSLCVKGTISEEEAAKAAAMELPTMYDMTSSTSVKQIQLYGLIQAEERHAEILGQFLYAAKVVAEKEDIADGFRAVINSGPSACQSGQSVYHLLHVLGGRQINWPPG